MRTLATKQPSHDSAKQKKQRNRGRSHSVSPLSTEIPLLQRKCACGGGCPRCQAEQDLEEALPIQTKLKISQPGDKYEQEADRVAEQVMRMPEPTVSESETTTQVGKETIQTKSATDEGSTDSLAVSPSIISLQSGGQPLSQSERAFFEPRFGTDFSQVRVHADSRAAEMAKSVNAKAFTFGHHIVFGAGQFAPETKRGKTLFAHELVHSIQQRAGEDQIQRETTGPLPLREQIELELSALRDPEQAVSCFEGDVITTMSQVTFSRWIPEICQTRSAQLRSNPSQHSATYYLHSREWDAFGHCWIGCEGTRRCGLIPTAVGGHARELIRELQDFFASGRRLSEIPSIREALQGTHTVLGVGTAAASRGQEILGGLQATLGSLEGITSDVPIVGETLRGVRTALGGGAAVASTGQEILGSLQTILSSDPRSQEILRGLQTILNSESVEQFVSRLPSGADLLRRVQRELRECPHDSYDQDVNNQTVGRQLSFRAGTCYDLCNGTRLDLSAPWRCCTNCDTYIPPQSDGPCPGAESLCRPCTS